MIHERRRGHAMRGLHVAREIRAGHTVLASVYGIYTYLCVHSCGVEWLFDDNEHASPALNVHALVQTILHRVGSHWSALRSRMLFGADLASK